MVAYRLHEKQPQPGAMGAWAGGQKRGVKWHVESVYVGGSETNLRARFAGERQGGTSARIFAQTPRSKPPLIMMTMKALNRNFKGGNMIIKIAAIFIIISIILVVTNERWDK